MKKAYLDPLKCPHCSHHVNAFVPPEIPRNPKLILVGEAPGVEEYRKGRPFVGPSGKVLRSVLSVDAIILNASNIYSIEKPTTEIISVEREHHLLPILEAYLHLPVVSLGAFAAQALVGGNRGGKKDGKEQKKGKQKKETSMAGQVLWLYDRPVLFTYHPAYYLRSGKDPRILEYIEAYVKSATAPPIKIKKFIDVLPPRSSIGAFELDVETTSSDLPFYDSKIVLLGIMPERLGIAYQFTATWLKQPANIRALQTWIDRNGQVVGHNIEFDILHCEAIGLNLGKLEWFDTEIAMKDKGHDLYGGFGLKYLAHLLYSAPPWEAKFHEHIRKMKTDKTKTLGIADFPLKDLSEYNAHDLYYTKRLAEARSGTTDPFVRLDNDYNKYINQMVENGIHISTRKLSESLKYYNGLYDRAAAKGRRLASLGKDFNYESPAQVLPVVKRLVGDIENTREQTLMTVYDRHPFIAALLDVRGHGKTIGMLEGIKERITKGDIVHSTLTEHGAETSRTSSKDPNIENWPEPIRKILVSRYGKK